MAPSSDWSVVRELRAQLPAGVFELRPWRLLWLPVHLAIVGAATFLIATRDVDFFTPLLSIVIGFSFAGLAFLAHETLHGSVVRRLALRRLVGLVSFAPFCLSPRLWMAWHNRVHHGHTNVPGSDPDAYPTLTEYENDARARLMVEVGAPGLGRFRGLITLLSGLSVQSLHMLIVAQRRGYLPKKQYRIALAETLSTVVFWASIGALIGPLAFLFAFVLPLALANAVVMAHIVTNHSLSRTGENLDDLDTSLSVTVPRWFDFYTLGFGYHVEHHMFPAMSGGSAPVVHRELLRRYPERYQVLPLWRALWLVHRTPRVHTETGRLVDPKTRRSVPTLPRLNRLETGSRPSDPPPSARLLLT